MSQRSIRIDNGVRFVKDSFKISPKWERQTKSSRNQKLTTLQETDW